MQGSGSHTLAGVRAISIEALAEHIAGQVEGLIAESDVTFPRIAIDAAIEADGAFLAGALVRVLDDAGRHPARVSASDFLRRRSVRLETGSADPEAGYWRWVDHDALRREVLDPFGASGRYLPSLWDAERDRPTRARPVQAPPGSVLIVDGPLLLRTELADAFDLRVHLRTGESALQRRLPLADVGRVIGAWAQYREWDDPENAADLVVVFDRPTRPALVGG